MVQQRKLIFSFSIIPPLIDFLKSSENWKEIGSEYSRQQHFVLCNPSPTSPGTWTCRWLSAGSRSWTRRCCQMWPHCCCCCCFGCSHSSCFHCCCCWQCSSPSAPATPHLCSINQVKQILKQILTCQCSKDASDRTPFITPAKMYGSSVITRILEAANLLPYCQW